MKTTVVTTKSSALLASVGLAALMLGAPGIVQAQEGQSQEDEAQAAAPAATPPARGEVIVVSGIRATYEDAVREKREADVILDGISADDLGNFPDLNLGEALQRIPGVQIDREAERRSASISVRGLPGQFTKTTVMGQNLAPATRESSNGSGAGNNPFGMFDSAVFNGANVIKSFTPEIQSGGLAANVDLRITSALSRRDGLVVARAEMTYEELPEAFAPGGFISASKHFGGSTFGVFGAVALSKQRFRRDGVNIAAYTAFPTSRYPELDPDPTVGGDYEVLFPGDIRQFVEQNEGYRLSAAGGMEWQPNDKLSVRFDGLFARRDLDKNSLDILQVGPRRSVGQITALGAPIFAGETEVNGQTRQTYFVPAIEFEDPQYTPGNRDFAFYEQSWGLYPQITWESGNWTVNAIGTYSKAENTFIQNQFQADVQWSGSTAATTGGNGITGMIDTGSGNIEDYILSLNVPDGALNLENGSWILLGNTITARNSASPQNRFTVAGNAQRSLREIRAFEAKLERKMTLGPITSVKVGGRYEEEEADALRQENSLIGVDLTQISNDFIVPNSALTSGQSFFGGSVPGYLQNFWYSMDRGLVRQSLLPIDPASVPEGSEVNEITGFYQRTPTSRTAARNFLASKETVEAFAMAKFDFTYDYGVPVRGNFGVRYTHSELSGRLKSADPSEPDADGKYESWLPSANVIVDFTDNLVMNFALYETFEVPNLVEFSPAPTTIIETAPGDNTDDEGDIAGSVRIDVSTLELEPRSSKAFDLGLIWYNRPGSLIGLNFFRKSVRANIVREPVCPEGGAFGFGPLFLDSSNICRIDDGGATNAENRRIVINQLVNLDEPLIVKGLEFQVQQNLDFLDGWLSGFGAVFNYTHVTSQSDSGETLPRVSKNTYNLVGYYEGKSWSLRLAQNYRSSYDLPAGSTFQGSERKVAGRSQLDLSASWEPWKGTSIRLQAFNLTNSIREEYQFFEELMRRTDYDGRTYKLSIQKRF